MAERPPAIHFASSTVTEDSPFERFLRHFDWVLFSTVCLLSLIGLVMVYSASLRFANPEVFIVKQFTALALGLVALFILATLNYQIFLEYPKSLFFLSISLLVLVLLVGTSYRGTRAWFALGPVAFQPSEIAKLITIILLGIWCSKSARDIRQVKNLAVPFLIVISHITLILFQPDFGSSLVYFPVLLGILFVAGARMMHLFVILFYGIVAALVLLTHTGFSLAPAFLQSHEVWNFIYKATRIGREFLILQLGLGGVILFVWWFSRQLRFRVPGFYFLCTFLVIAAGWSSSSLFLDSLKDYQRKRLDVLFRPSIDPAGAGYHAIQSKIAIGSGKLFGKGLFSGTQGQLGFLPEQHTDFIFSVLGEELGFVAGGLVLLLYFILLWRAIAIAGDSRDRFGALVAVGIGCMFAFYTFLNLGMVMGILPITGLPLPFLSYGGSSLFSSLAAVGILLSIHVRRYTH